MKNIDKDRTRIISIINIKFNKILKKDEQLKKVCILFGRLLTLF